MTDLPPRSEDGLARPPTRELRLALDEFLGGPGETRRLALVLTKGLGATVATLIGVGIVWSALSTDQPNRSITAGRTEAELLTSGRPPRSVDPEHPTRAATFGAGGASQTDQGDNAADENTRVTTGQPTSDRIGGGAGSRSGTRSADGATPGEPTSIASHGGVDAQPPTGVAEEPEPAAAAEAGEGGDNPAIPPIDQPVVADPPTIEGEATPEPAVGADPALSEGSEAVTAPNDDVPPAGPEIGPEEEPPPPSDGGSATTQPVPTTSKPTTTKVPTTKATTTKNTTTKNTGKVTTTTTTTAKSTTTMKAVPKSTTTKATTKATAQATTKTTATSSTTDATAEPD